MRPGPTTPSPSRRLRAVLTALGTTMLLVTVAAACRDADPSASAPTGPSTSAAVGPGPSVVPSDGPSSSGPADGPATSAGAAPTSARPTLPDSVPERVDNAYDYETVPAPPVAALPTVVLPPLGTSPAERAATAPPPTVRVGAVDGDRAAAAPDTRIPVRSTLPTPTAPAEPGDPPVVTVADLRIDAAAAERLLGRIAWPDGLAVVPMGDPDVAANAAAAAFAGDPVLRAAIRSAGGRLLQRGQQQPVVASLLVVDVARLGSNPLSVVRRSVRGADAARADLIGTTPALILEGGGGRTVVAVGRDRLVAATGAAEDEATVRAVVATLLAA